MIRGLTGSYLSRDGVILQDRINVIFTDTPLLFAEDRDEISRYTDHVRRAAFLALDEEAVLVVAHPVYHSE